MNGLLLKTLLIDGLLLKTLLLDGLRLKTLLLLIVLLLEVL